ncbi:MAG: ATP/GTP-binding protein [Chitinophagaceae bacterium]|nr:ATP/GTP-binding protein [Chitinophagaceae bacterium]
MKPALICIALFSFVLVFSTAQSQERKLVKQWETDTILKVPESVLFDGKNKVLYVANIDGGPWEKDGKGSIGKVGLDGKIIATEWVTGLNAPKGMGIHAGKLYVADVDAIAVIDIAQGKIADRIVIDGAKGLNDISIDAKGVVYVSDSHNKTILKVENGKVSTVLENLKGPNGVLVVGKDLYITDAGTLNKVEANGSLKQLADGMEGGTDGIEHAGKGDFIVSCWAGSVWYIHANGKKDHLLDTREQKINSADIGFDPVKKILYVPTFFKNSVVAYAVQ